MLLSRLAKPPIETLATSYPVIVVHRCRGFKNRRPDPHTPKPGTLECCPKGSNVLLRGMLSEIIIVIPTSKTPHSTIKVIT